LIGVTTLADGRDLCVIARCGQDYHPSSPPGNGPVHATGSARLVRNRQREPVIPAEAAGDATSSSQASPQSASTALFPDPRTGAGP